MNTPIVDDAGRKMCQDIFGIANVAATAGDSSFEAPLLRVPKFGTPPALYFGEAVSRRPSFPPHETWQDALGSWFSTASSVNDLLPLILELVAGNVGKVQAINATGHIGSRMCLEVFVVYFSLERLDLLIREYKEPVNSRFE